MADQGPVADYTGGGLIAFLDAAIAKGWLNVSTAKGLRTATTKVLEIEPGWESIDLRSVEIDSLFHRFQNLRRNDYGDASMRVYRTRLGQAVKMYVARLDGDANWQAYGPSAKSSGSSRSNGENGSPKSKKTASVKVGTASPPVAPTHHEASSVRQEAAALMRYPFPLRDDLDAVLSLPRDLTKSEAARLSAFLSSLARDDAPVNQENA